MSKKNTGKMSFADVAISQRKINTQFFDQINTLIDWRRIEELIDRYDQRGKGIAGNSAYPGVLLFKMCLLGIWYGLSDRQLEDRVNDSISFSRFCGLSMSDSVPDHSIVSRFRTMMTRQGGWDELLKEINRQLEQHQILVRTGTIVDASITETRRKPRGKARYEVIDRDDEGNDLPLSEMQFARVGRPGIDPEAAWTIKAGKLYYGYKKHQATDYNGLVLAVETTAANTHDSKVFEHLVEVVNPPKKTPVLADKGYSAKAHDRLLRSRKLINGIQKKAARGKPLSDYYRKKNKSISRLRYVAERTFGSQKRWFGGGTTRYIGLAATHTLHVLEAICYNLKRAPRLYAEVTAPGQLNA